MRRLVRRLRRRVASEAGITLAEVIVAIAVLGIGVAGVASGLGAASMSSDRHRKQVTSDWVVRDYAEAVKEYVRTVGYPEGDTAAATAAKYSYDVVSAAIGYEKPDGYNVGLSAQKGIQFQSSANLNVVLVLDTSGSVDTSSARQSVRDAAMAFVNELSETGAKVAIVSFDDTAVVRKQPTPVTAASIPAFQAALPSDSDFGGYTNWDDGLGTAFSTLSTFGQPSPPLVVFVTDGNPNRWILNNSNPKSVQSSGGEARALQEAQEQKELIEHLYYSRIFAIGVRGNEGIDTNNLKAISGPDRFPDSEFDDADWMEVSGFGDLTTSLKIVAEKIRKDYFDVEPPASGDQGAHLLTLVASSEDGRASETLQIIVRRP